MNNQEALARDMREAVDHISHFSFDLLFYFACDDVDEAERHFNDLCASCDDLQDVLHRWRNGE